MKVFFGVILCSTALLVPVAVLAGNGAGFDGVVGTIESRYHAHATRIPFMGLISLIARKGTHEGVANLHVADFESFPADVDGGELNQIVEEKLGPEWERVIRETSRHGGEQTLIFMRPEGDRMGLFILDKDQSELNVVQVSVDPAHIDDDINRYSHHHGDSRRESGTDTSGL
jgi:hypothetical protein